MELGCRCARVLARCSDRSRRSIRRPYRVPSGTHPLPLPRGCAARWIPGADSQASRDRPDPRLRVARGTSRRGSRACFGVPASGCRRWARPQHRDRRRPAGEPRRRDRQAAPPGDGRVLRGPLFPTGIRRQPLSRLRVQRVRRARWRPLRPADLLGRVVSGGRARVFARRREHRGVSDGQRFGARPSGLRYPAALAEGDHWQRHRERSFHGRSAPVRPGERMQP